MFFFRMLSLHQNHEDVLYYSLETYFFLPFRFKSTIHLNLIFVYGMSWRLSFFYTPQDSCPNILASFIEKTVLSPLLCCTTFVKHHMLINTWALYSFYLSVLSPTSHLILMALYWIFMKRKTSSHFQLFFKRLLAIFVTSHFYLNFKINVSSDTFIFCGKADFQLSFSGIMFN